MGIIKKVLASTGKALSRLTLPHVCKYDNETMLRIIVARNLSLSVLYKKWSEKAYEALEKARLTAQSKGFLLVELQMLLEEVSILIGRHKDKQLFYAANRRLIEMYRPFDINDDDFADKFNSKYKRADDTETTSKIDAFLKEGGDYFFHKAEFMFTHLQYATAVLCCKAVIKIASLSDVVTTDKLIGAYFISANCYMNLSELSSATECLNKAIGLARDVGDAAYEYALIIRKLGFIKVANDISVLFDTDTERISAASELLALCDKCGLNLYEIGTKLSTDEKDISKKGLVDEATLSLGKILALERGDRQTVSCVEKKLKAAEIKAYGEQMVHTDNEALGVLYHLFYESAEREQAQAVAGESTALADECNLRNSHLFFGGNPVKSFQNYSTNALEEAKLRHLDGARSYVSCLAEIARAVHSDYHLALSWCTLAKACEYSEETQEAIKAYEETLKILREPEHAGSDVHAYKGLLHSALSELGSLKLYSDAESAVKLLSDAIDAAAWATDVVKDATILYALVNRSLAYRMLSRREDSEKDLTKVIDWIMSRTGGRLPFMDSELRENYWRAIGGIIDNVVCQADENSSTSLRKKLYELVLYAKGFLLSSERAVKAAVYSDETPDSVRRLYEDIERYERKRHPWGTSTPDSSQEYVNRWMQNMRLTCAVAGIAGKYIDFINRDYHVIVAYLNEKDIVIDYFDYAIDDTDRRYVAFVYGRGDEVPHLIKVCREADIAKIYDDVSKDGCRFTEAYNPERGYSKALYDCVLRPIVDKMKIERDVCLYLMPSGSLHKIPIESLTVSEETHDIVSDRFRSVTRISHARTIKTLHAEGDLSNISLFGGLDYGFSSGESSDERGYRMNDDGNEATPLLPWNDIEHSLREVNDAAFRWEMVKGRDTATVYKQKEGTAERFFNLSGRKVSVIHIATHGFFETAKTAVNLPALEGRINPMDLSGLVMSNGNEGWLHGNPMSREGILTAADIAKMDLTGTSLVVLSACDSGNGTVGSDGVYGLQRAFKKAGVKSILMSLWYEADEVGLLFMRSFYKHLVSDGMSKEEAFVRAKNDIRKQPRYSHPEYWANFVMID